MMGILNKHQLKFNSIKDATKLMEAVEKGFGGNGSFKSLNKADLDTMSMNDLYNNLKVYKPEVKGMSSSSSISTARTQVNDANSTNIDNLNDVVICAFFASQPNSPQLVHEDLQQFHPNDMEEISKKSRQQEQRKLKKECAWEGPNYALMAFSSSSPDSEVSNDSICLKSCLETVELLKSQNDQLLKDLKKSELMVLGYKTGLKSVEEKLKVYKANESIYSQDIKGLKFEIHIGEITIRELRKKLETVQKEKDGIQLNVDKFEHASKIPSPYTGNFMPPAPDLSFTSLDEFVNESVVENSKAMSSKEEPKVVRKNDDAPIIEEWVSDDEVEDVVSGINLKRKS
ncbi:hypothetical protein Tco_0155272 [Tanacetum coccineum]